MRPTLVACSGQITMTQQRRYHHHNSGHRLSGRRSAGTVERLRQQLIMVANVVPLCVLAVMFALGLQFDSCDHRRAPSHLAGATAQGTGIGLPGGVATLSATDCTPLRAASKRYHDRQDRHLSGAAGRRVSSTAAMHTAYCSMTNPAAAALGVRGGGKAASRSSQQPERKRARARNSAFVHAGLSLLHSAPKSRQKNTNADCRQEQLTTRDTSSHGGPVARVVAIEQLNQRQYQRPQWPISAGKSGSRMGSSPARSSKKYSPARWWNAAVAAASPGRLQAGGEAARPFRAKEHKQHRDNSPLCSVWQRSARRQQQPPQSASAASSSVVRDHRTALSVKDSESVEAEIGGGGKPPLLITIGPQCCGKTTLLRALAARGSKTEEVDPASGGVTVATVIDIAIDDYPEVGIQAHFGCCCSTG